MLETAGLFGIGSAYTIIFVFMLHSSVFYIVTVTSQRQNEIALVNKLNKWINLAEINDFSVISG